MPKKLSLHAKSMFFLLLSSLFVINANAQKIIVGKVINSADNRPLAGATVAIKGSTTGTQTETDGTYRVTVPNDKSVLVITAIGIY